MRHDSLASHADLYPFGCSPNLLDRTLVRVDRQTYNHFLKRKLPGAFPCARLHPDCS